MTDRIKGFTVILHKDYRDDDVETISSAISMIKGVQQVIPHVSGAEDTILAERTKMDFKAKLYEIIKDI